MALVSPIPENDVTPVIVDVLKEVVEKTSEKLFNTLGTDINYMYGTAQEIEDNLIEITKMQSMDAVKKYPLIAVLTERIEERDNAGGYYCDAYIPNIFFFTITKQSLKAETRTAVSFKQVLDPIYHEFMNQLRKHESTVIIGPIKHSCNNNYFWGREKAFDKLSDYVDAKEIKNLEITLQQFCSKN